MNPVRYVLALAAFLLFSVPAHGQWTTVSPDAIIHHFRSADFIDNRTGFAAGWIGIGSGTGGVQSVMVRTTDGGGTWRSETVNQVEINAVHTFDAERAIGVGRGYLCNCPVVVRTTDGGASWEEETVSGLAGSFTSLDFRDGETGIVGGGNAETGEGYILRTTDGGETFQPVFVGEGAHVARVVMASASVAYAIGGAESGGENTIYKSVNINDFQENVEWEPVKTFDGFATVTGIDFVSPEEGYVSVTVFDAGDFRGEVWKTADGGAEWTNLFSSLTVTLFAIDFIDAQSGIAVGDNSVIIRTDDGGANWSEDVTRVTQQLSDIEFLNAGMAYAVGTDGTVMKYDQSSSAPAAAAADRVSVRVEFVPAPVTDRAAVRVVGTAAAGTCRLILCDGLGRTVRQIELEEGKGILQTEGLPSGAYFYRVMRGEGEIAGGGVVLR